MSMQVIEHIEVGAVTDEIVLDNIPADYTDLKIVYSLRSEGGGEAFWFGALKLNTTTAGSRRILLGNGASASSTSSATGVIFYYSGSTSTSSTFGNGEIYIPNYLSTENKSISIDNVSENNATTAYQAIHAGLITLASAVTSVTLLGGEGQDFSVGSSATLFGITAGSDGITTVG